MVTKTPRSHHPASNQNSKTPSGAGPSPSNSNVKVVVRIRPQSCKEVEGNFSNVVQALDDHILVFDPADDHRDQFGTTTMSTVRKTKRKSRDMRFAFDRVFGPSATNKHVYDNCVRSILDCLLNGINCSVFAYGATGAGKTHTMLGNMEYPGVTFHTMMELYERIEDMKDEKSCDVAVSYLEIYNETIQDLLQPSGALPIREDPTTGIVIKGLTLHKPKNARDLLEMLYAGNQNRTQHPTDANKESSRSHAVFQVFVRQKDRTANLTADIHMAKMSLIDLAGSERATATANRGARFREGANINRSLLALGNVINALADGRNSGRKNQHIPYRDSKLTRLLKDSIGGNCSTVMITAVSPSSMSYEDTYNSLKYADRAKNIKATLKKNVLSVDMHVSRYVKIVEELRTEISELKEKLQGYEGGAMTPFNQRQADNAKQEEISRLKTLFSTIFTKKLSLRNELMEYECSERDLTLKIHQKQLAVKRLNAICSSDKTTYDKIHLKLNHAIEAAEKRRETIASRKSDVDSRLTDNNSWFNRAENEAKLIGEDCQALPEVLRDFVKMRRLEVEVRDSRRQVKHLQKLARQQDSEQENMNKLVLTLMRTVKRQYYIIKGAGLASSEVTADFNSCENMVLGNHREIAWNDRKASAAHRGFDIQDILDFPGHVTCSPIVYNPKTDNASRRKSLIEHFAETEASPIISDARTPATEKRRVNFAGRTPIPKMNSFDIETPVKTSESQKFAKSPLRPINDATIVISRVVSSSPFDSKLPESSSPQQNETFTIFEEGIPDVAPETPDVSERPVRKMVTICPGTYVKPKSLSKSDSEEEFHPIEPRLMSYADAVKSPPLAVPLPNSNEKSSATSKQKAELRLKFNASSPSTEQRPSAHVERSGDKFRKIQNLDFNEDEIDEKTDFLKSMNLPVFSPGKRLLKEHVANQRRQTLAASRVTNKLNRFAEPKRVSVYHRKPPAPITKEQRVLEKFGIPVFAQRSILTNVNNGSGCAVVNKPSYMAPTKSAMARKTDSHKRSVSSMKENIPTVSSRSQWQTSSRVFNKHSNSRTVQS